jgi:hypothetical protein
LLKLPGSTQQVQQLQQAELTSFLDGGGGDAWDLKKVLLPLQDICSCRNSRMHEAAQAAVSNSTTEQQAMATVEGSTHST